MNQQLKSLLKRTGLYHPLQTFYRSALLFAHNQYYRVTYNKYRGKGFRCNFCGASYEKFVPEYPSAAIQKAIDDNEVIAGYGENVYCPHCMSKNRERLIKAVIQTWLPAAGKNILHFSPERHLYGYLKETASVTTVDITPGFYIGIDRSITYADATDLPFPDANFDIVIANHILEHIPEDHKAMKEMYRVLRPGGTAVLQVPYSEKLPQTVEDPYIDDPDRQAALYGQKDHVRIYALNDYRRRLESAGFSVHLVTPGTLAPFRIHAIQEKESVFLCYKTC
jgi:SAM-dependent methyltransferase